MFFPHGGRERINPGRWHSLQRPTRLRPLFSRAGHRRIPGSLFIFESGDPPLVRFVSLQRSLAALCCPGLPASDDPASAFSSRDHPKIFACGSFALAVFLPHSIIARASSLPTLPPRGVIRRMFSSFRRSGPAVRGVCGLAGLFGPGGAHGILYPSQFFSGRSGVIAFRRSRTRLSFSSRTSRGL